MSGKRSFTTSDNCCAVAGSNSPMREGRANRIRVVSRPSISPSSFCIRHSAFIIILIPAHDSPDSPGRTSSVPPIAQNPTLTRVTSECCGSQFHIDLNLPVRHWRMLNFRTTADSAPGDTLRTPPIYFGGSRFAPATPLREWFKITERATWQSQFRRRPGDLRPDLDDFNRAKKLNTFSVGYSPTLAIIRRDNPRTRLTEREAHCFAVVQLRRVADECGQLLFGFRATLEKFAHMK